MTSYSAEVVTVSVPTTEFSSEHGSHRRKQQLQQQQQRGQFPVAQSVLTVHMLYDLPREMQQLDPRREQLEIVIKPLVRYEHRERRITHISLGERVMPFSSSSILFKGGRFVLDLDNVTTPNATTTGGAGAPGSPAGSTCGRWHPADDDDDDNEDKDNDKGQRSVVRGNHILLQYPCPRGLTTLVDVLVGIRQRRVGSSVVRWITKSLNTNTVDGAVYFSVATEEVNRKKCVTRVVGLPVGGAVCSVAVNQGDDRECVVRRLMQDMNRYAAKYGANVLKNFDISKMLREGRTEQEIHREMLLLVDPGHYVRRLEALLALYTSNNAEWRQTDLLLREYAGREEELMRRAAIEIGPECCTVSSRHRLMAFRKKYSNDEQDLLVDMQSLVDGNFNEMLDVEPEIVFAALTMRDRREPRPALYLFPARTYTPDRRTFFFETLHFPLNRSGENYRDMALASRSKRAPFTMSPCERPLHIKSSKTRPGKPSGEIEILREKYAPEFTQIVPSIADALQAVVEQNRQLVHPSLVDNGFLIFQQLGLQPQLRYQDFVHRTAEYTFISPSSLLGALIYLDRLCLRHPSLIITERNVLRLFLTSVRVASKTVELRSINNRHFGNVYGLDAKTMNLLEEVFVKQLQFDLFLSPEEFGEYSRLLQPASAYQFRAFSSQRGYLDARTLADEELPQLLLGIDGSEKKLAGGGGGGNVGYNRYPCSSDAPINEGEPVGNNGTIKGLQLACDVEAAKPGERCTKDAAPKRITNTIISNNGSTINYVCVSNGVTTMGMDAGEDVDEACRVIVGSRNQTDREQRLAV